MIGRDQMILPAMITFMVLMILLFDASLSFIMFLTGKMM
ncbi:sensor histidine kinase regB [Bacillus cereus HD73]|uniref:Uncharacterized protein n=1 Tax=Bacillus thuringiensis subsp. kurstaki TaxID=29339 RepID=Q3YN35_BACTK|nr:hypothetical protein pAW63_040 [Bacillus thuringiensis serovar kurstaki]AGE81687.1 hypothetical protein HD73_7540 [Bacillus thuringiensis serovar kurstaki str. HD73]EJV73152.1 sensor histidine kinase regB [Bacillus cereus HD73]